jgi:AAHS family 4-hydroxybenzoate transporter-like MFS transporter
LIARDKSAELREKSVTTPTMHVPYIINEGRISAFQYMIVVLCGLVMLIDGFDTQAISYMAPLMAKEWHISQILLGPIFASALVGLMVGYLALAPLSDRFGHRRMLIGSTIFFAVFTGVTIFATNVTELIVLRFVTGAGLGAAVPSAIALSSEYTPKRLRATFVLAIYCGFSFGFVVAGMAAAWLLIPFGWRSLLWIGAGFPLALSVILLVLLPDSLDQLVRAAAKPDQIWIILRRIDPRLTGTPTPGRFTTDQEEKFSAVGSVFRAGRIAGTLLLWFVFALNLGEFYALQTWLPTILTDHYYSLTTVATATSLTTTGGIIAAFIVGPAMDRVGAYGSLLCLYLAGVLFVALIGVTLDRPEWILLGTAFFAGFCVSGGQKSVIALSALFYPAPIRSTGVGWALGVGRLGGIAGPLLMGMLIQQHVAATNLFLAASIPMLLAAISVAVMGLVYRQRDTTRAMVTTGA